MEDKEEEALSLILCPLPASYILPLRSHLGLRRRLSSCGSRRAVCSHLVAGAPSWRIGGVGAAGVGAPSGVSLACSNRVR